MARSLRPDVILAPSPGDAHQDHRTVGELVPTAFRDQLFLAYEIPKWDGDLARPNTYFPLTDEIARRKVELLRQVLPLPARPRLVGRGDIPRACPAARHGVPRALRGGIHLHEADHLLIVDLKINEHAMMLPAFFKYPDIPAADLRQRIYSGTSLSSPGCAPSPSSSKICRTS